MPTHEARWFGPGEIANRLGVTPKALRVYEREGLVTPHRTEGGWRAYGPAEVERLHLVLALRDLGLPLKKIAALIRDRQTDLLTVLSAQQDLLEAQQRKITRGIGLLAAARTKLAEGRALSLDDLIHLTKETLMQTSSATKSAMKTLETRFEAALEDRLPGQAENALADLKHQIAATGKSKDEISVIVRQLMAEARDFMTRGDETSDGVKALVVRWRAFAGEFAKPEPHIREAMSDALNVAANDPSLKPDLPFDPAVIQFVMKVAKGMKARGELN